MSSISVRMDAVPAVPADGSSRRGGFAATAGAYAAWGILPLYWKWLTAVPAGEILAHRIVWSFAAMALLATLGGWLRKVASDIKALAAAPRRLVCAVAGAGFICANWFTFIWAVNAGKVLEASLGYYIAPLTNILLGVVFLRERLLFWQKIAVALAAAGVAYLALGLGAPPWAALSLAFTIAFYGLCKKVAALSAVSGMTLETALAMPAALGYLLWLHGAGQGIPWTPSATLALLAGTGIVTVAPLLCFAYGLNRLPLTTIGILQYIMPTLALVLGIFVFHEPFGGERLIAFACIWIALVLYAGARKLPDPSGSKP